MQIFLSLSRTKTNESRFKFVSSEKIHQTEKSTFNLFHKKLKQCPRGRFLLPKTFFYVFSVKLIGRENKQIKL